MPVRQEDVRCGGYFFCIKNIWGASGQKKYNSCENAKGIRLQSDGKLCILKEKHTFLHKI